CCKCEEPAIIYNGLNRNSKSLHMRSPFTNIKLLYDAAQPRHKTTLGISQEQPYHRQWIQFG
ncbi:MAG: hypothetical protein KH619_08375, partial [Veillonella sp.]|nr:hypothetical protein [Veillonella sp.]